MGGGNFVGGWLLGGAKSIQMVWEQLLWGAASYQYRHNWGPINPSGWCQLSAHRAEKDIENFDKVKNLDFTLDETQV